MRPRSLTPTQNLCLKEILKLHYSYWQGGALNLEDPVDHSNPEYLVCDVLRAKHSPAQPLTRVARY